MGKAQTQLGWLGLLLLGGMVAIMGGGCEAPTVKPSSQEAEMAPVESSIPAEIELKLQFRVGDKVQYQIEQDIAREVKWEGVPAEKADKLKSGLTRTWLRMTYDQEVLSLDSTGNASVRVTIRDLVFRHKLMNKDVLDYDSSRPADHRHPMNDLLGAGYTMTLSPYGHMLAVTNREGLKVELPKGTEPARVVDQLFSVRSIRKRHSIPTLMTAGNLPHAVGSSWDIPVIEDFQAMGRRSFHKIYTVESVSTEGGVQEALVSMKTEPSTYHAQSESQTSGTNPFLDKMDSQATYDGNMRLDLLQGSVVEMSEELKVVWLSLVREGTSETMEPMRSTMTSERKISLKRLEP